MTNAQIIELRIQIQTIKKGSQTAQDYLRRIKFQSDQLAAAGEPVTDKDLVLYTLGGYSPPSQSPLRSAESDQWLSLPNPPRELQIR